VIRGLLGDRIELYRWYADAAFNVRRAR